MKRAPRVSIDYASLAPAHPRPRSPHQGLRPAYCQRQPASRLISHRQPTSSAQRLADRSRRQSHKREASVGEWPTTFFPFVMKTLRIGRSAKRNNGSVFELAQPATRVPSNYAVATPFMYGGVAGRNRAQVYSRGHKWLVRQNQQFMSRGLTRAVIRTSSP